MSTVRVFTPRSTGISIAGGVLVAGALGQFIDAAWGLAILNGLAAGALALVGSVCMRHGRFAFLTEKAHQRQFGVGMLTYAVMVPPMFFVGGAIGMGLLDRGDEFALSVLLGSTAFAAYNLGGILATLAYLDGEAAVAESHLHRAAPPRGEPGPMSPVRVFTARSTGIGIATGLLVALALEQFLGAPWGLAILNGLAAGALALALSCGVVGDGWFFDMTDNQRRPGTWALAYAVMIAPPIFVRDYIELRPTDEIAVSLLYMLTGFASYILGNIMATLVYLDGDAAAADPRLHRVTPPPGERRGT